MRLKEWKTPSHERVCEIQLLEGNGSGTQRYTQYQQRRYSDFSLTTIPQIPPRRRASEMPPRPVLAAVQPPAQQPPPIPPRTGRSAGIVCTNTDLISILSSLTSSATEIDRCGADDEREPKSPPSGAGSAKSVENKRNRYVWLMFFSPRT